MIILGIDPSPTNTAMVAVNDSGSVLWASTFHARQFLSEFHAVTWEIDARWNEILTEIAIERPPHSPGRMSAESSQTIGAYWHILWTMEQEFASEDAPKIHSIGPGSWKPAAKGWGIKKPATLKTLHEFDAYRIVIVTMKGKIPYERES